jgi:hypothetical protein
MPNSMARRISEATWLLAWLGSRRTRSATTRNGAFHDPTVVASRVGQFECSLVDALEVTGSQLIAVV